MRGGNTAHYKNMGKGIPQKVSFHHLFTANVCDGGCKRLRWRLQTFTMAVANVCDGGCKRLRERMQTFAVKRGSALQGQMQCTARADAVHCGSGCSALRLRWVKLASKSPVLFWIREKGGEMHHTGHLYPPGNICRALISAVERTNRKLSFLLAERRVSDISIFGCESVPASLREKKG